MAPFGWEGDIVTERKSLDKFIWREGGKRNELDKNKKVSFFWEGTYLTYCHINRQWNFWKGAMISDITA